MQQPVEPSRPVRRSGLRWLGILLSLLLLAALTVAAMGWRSLHQPLNLPAGGQTLHIESGETFNGLINDLGKQRVIENPFWARLYARFVAKKSLKSGYYELRPGMTPQTLITELSSGKMAQMNRIQLIEGHRFSQFWSKLQADDKVEHTLSGTTPDEVGQALGLKIPEASNLEGWLAPDTYYFARGQTDRSILEHMVERQKATLDKEWASRATNLPYKTPYEALIMASIIEKETGIGGERDKVAAVFVNRLRKPMRLQTDPTVIYGIPNYNGNITRKDLETPTPYNTYTIDGLPPTPISMPSAESIRAALHPANIDALFFVATGNGGHTFTNNLADHNAAVAAYLRTLREKRTAQRAQEG